MIEQGTDNVFCFGTVSAQIGTVTQSQRVDVQGRYAFVFEGFDPEEKVVLNAKVQGFLGENLEQQLSQLTHPHDFVLRRQKPAAVGATIGGLAGGGPLPAARPDASHLVKGSASGRYP